MKYYLRYTDNAEQDLKRGTSVNASDFGKGEIKKSRLAEMFGCRVEQIQLVDGVYCQILEGLCGYELEADNLEDAIEEVEEGTFQSSFVGQPVIFLGKSADDNNYVADGDLFHPVKIEVKL